MWVTLTNSGQSYILKTSEELLKRLDGAEEKIKKVCDHSVEEAYKSKYKIFHIPCLYNFWNISYLWGKRKLKDYEAFKKWIADQPFYYIGGDCKTYSKEIMKLKLLANESKNGEVHLCSDDIIALTMIEAKAKKADKIK